jgi:hypothetical protein
VTTLEEQFLAPLKLDPRYHDLGPALVKGIFILGAQSALECIKERCPSPTTKNELIDAMYAVNEEIGANLAAMRRVRKLS